MAYIKDIVVSVQRLTRGIAQQGFSLPLILSEEIAQRTLTVGTGTSGITWTTNAGHYVEVVYVVSGNSTTLSVARSGSGTEIAPYVITVTVGTNISGVATSTALQVKTAADLVANVTGVVNITLVSSGAGVVAALAQAPLVIDTVASKALVYREFGELSEMTGIYAVTDDVYKMASKLLSQTRRPKTFAVYCKVAAQSITAALAELIETENDWYYLLHDSRLLADLHECGDFASANTKIFIGGSDDITALDARENDREAYLIDNANDFAECAWAGLMSTYEPGTATWKWKSLSNITASNFTSTQLSNIRSGSGQTITKQSGVAYVNNGVLTFDGEFIDTIVLQDYVVARINENIFRLLVTTPKVTMDPDGLEKIAANVRATLRERALVGAIAVVDTANDADLLLSDDGQYKYKVTTPAMADITDNDKANRILNNVTATFYVSGAIHEVGVNLIITV